MKKEIKEEKNKENKKIEAKKEKAVKKTKNKVKNKSKIIAWLNKVITIEKFVLIVSLVAVFYIALILTVNLVSNNDSIFSIDTTYSKIFKLTKESKQIIKSIDEPIEITIDSRLQVTQLTELLKQIAKLNRKITIVETEITVDEDDEEVYYATIFVSATDRDNIHSVFDLNFDASLINSNTYKQYSLLEERLVNALIAVTEGDPKEEPSVAFLSNLEGSELDEELNNLYLELIFYGIQSITLDLKTTEIPESIETIAIIGTMKDLSKTEYNRLVEFQARGGNFVIAGTYIEENSHPRLDKILSSYGVSLPVGAVLDYKDGYRYTEMQSIGVPINYNNIILPIPTSDNEITKDMAFEDSAPLFIFPTKINFESEEKLKEKNVTHTNHLLTSDMAVFETGDIGEEEVTKKELPPDAVSDIFVLGTIAEKKMTEEVTSTAVIYSNSLFMTDLIIQNLTDNEIILEKDNLRLAKNSFTYLSSMKDKMKTIKKALIVSPYKYEKNTFVMHRVVTYVLFGIPMLVIATLGAIMMYKRGYLEKYGFSYKGKEK